MRRMFKLSVLVIFLTVMFPSELLAASYGWGYKKNYENKIPDIGKYAQIIEDYPAYYIDDSGEKVIYLTFDNGYEMGYTEEILNILQRENVPATFFLTGHYVDVEPELVKRMVDAGHIIGNHSNHHPDFTSLTKEKMKKELDALEKKVYEITDQDSFIYLRPPRGTFNEQTLAWAEELGYVHVFWSVAFKDWLSDVEKGWRYAYDQIMQQVHPGAIILLHTVSPDNTNALERVIQDLKKDGYLFKSLDDLMLKKSLPDNFIFN